MFCTEIDLGSSIHIHSKHKLRLAVTASAQVSLPSPDHTNNLSSMTLPEIFTSRDTWVSLGHGLKLTVDAYLNGTIRGSRPTSLAFSEIGEILEHADLWSDLGLATSLINPSTPLECPDSARFEYTIQPNVTDSQSSKARKAPYSGRVVDEANIKPPEGLPAAVIQEINVSFCFHPVEQISKANSYPQIKQRDRGFDDLLFALDYFNPEQLDSIGIPGALRPEITKSPDPVYQFPLPREGYCEFSEDGSPFSSQESQLSRPSHSFQSQIKGENITEDMDIEPFIMLIDSGFRGLICDKPIRTAAGIKVHAEGPSLKLADAAPAIFSPRYLPAISQRERYIPMIAKSLSTIMGKTKSLKLKKKSKLLDEAYRARTGTISDGTTATPDTRSTLKCLLWMSLQRGTLDPGAARRLGRLHTSRRVDALQHSSEKAPNPFLYPNNPDSDPMIDVPDEFSFEPENYIEQPANDDPYDDLLFSELGLHEEDDEPYNMNPFDNNLDAQAEEDTINFIDRVESPLIPLTPNENLPYSNVDYYEILDPPTSPSHNLNSPKLPILPASGLQPIPSSSPPLSMTAELMHNEAIIPDSDIPPSSPPINPMEVEYGNGNTHGSSDDMLLS